MKTRNLLCASLVLLTLLSCGSHKDITASGLRRSDFNAVVDNEKVALYTLKNANGMEACITNYGARVVSLMVPDRDGKLDDVVCGYPSISGYVDNKQNFGAAIGRYIGRILGATFTLDGTTYHLDANTAGVHCAHGGNPGFAVKVWRAKQIGKHSLQLTLTSPDGENGFPGNLEVTLLYTLTDDNELRVLYTATTDKPTVINLSHHSFFNISGDFNSTVENQTLYVNADSITPYDSQKCVTGEIRPVGGTPFDFTTPRRVGERINDADPQLTVTGGYDHNWVLNTAGDETRLAASITDGRSGRTMEVYTDEPGLQIYTANGLKGATVGKGGVAYAKRTAICFEAQHFADSPNKPHFPSTVLRPGEKYRSICVYKFKY